VPPWLRLHFTPWFAESLAIVAVNCCWMVTGSKALVGVSEIVIAGTVTAALAVAPVLNTEVAVTVTGKSSIGGVAGAVYVVATPLAVFSGETVPHGPGEHVTLQVTPLLLGSFATVAVNCVLAPACTVAESGETTTLIPGTVILAEAVALLLATAVAVKVTERSPAGGLSGAV